MVNWLAVIVAAIINMVLGFLWYGPFFGKPWRQMMGMSLNPDDYKMSGAMYRSLGIGFVLALIMNFVFAHMIGFTSMISGIPGLQDGLWLGFFIWLGFILVATSGVCLWEGKPLKLWAIHASYYLVLLLINGALLGGWM